MRLVNAGETLEEQKNWAIPCKTTARMRVVIASETPEKQSTLWHCGSHANFECQHCKASTRLYILYSNAMEPLRECNF